MGIFEIISAIILIIACVFIVVVVLMKDTKTQMSQTISGSTADSYYGKNSGRTKDAMLNKATIAACVVFFVLALAVNIINGIYAKKSTEDTGDANNSAGDVPAVTATAEAGEDNGAVVVTAEANAPAETTAADTTAETTAAATDAEPASAATAEAGTAQASTTEAATTTAAE